MLIHVWSQYVSIHNCVTSFHIRRCVVLVGEDWFPVLPSFAHYLVSLLATCCWNGTACDTSPAQTKEPQTRTDWTVRRCGCLRIPYLWKQQLVIHQQNFNSFSMDIYSHSECRYRWLIGPPFPHCGIASLAPVSTMTIGRREQDKKGQQWKAEKKRLNSATR